MLYRCSHHTVLVLVCNDFIDSNDNENILPQPKKVPLTMAYCGDHHTLVTASADMTLLQWYLDDIPAIKHFTLKSRWPTKHAAMSMCWSSSHRLLYSGTTAGTIQGDCTIVVSLSRKRRAGAGRGVRRCDDCDSNRREASEYNCSGKSSDVLRGIGMGCGFFTSGNILTILRGFNDCPDTKCPRTRP